ncbi:unnamed protein product [Paramecium sonneborni]|uniref:Uncharacterized protein n=1 Tax=Paramecium sonneborni TaxID=65129 RepID=A0A8S1RQ15_9CILI|nr:unnamed protein product [Paramecium sonneborni]
MERGNFKNQFLFFQQNYTQTMKTKWIMEGTDRKFLEIYEIGEYENNQRNGVWKYNYCDQDIDFGEYNEQGQRIGKWTELSDGFWDQLQITYKGEYRNDKKVGNWDIYYNKTFHGHDVMMMLKLQNFCGGGLYDDQYQEGGDLKIWMWIELNDWFWYLSLVIYHGQYKNGKKVGRWDIIWKKYYEDYTNELMYRYNQQIQDENQEEAKSVRIGEWIELTDSFWRDSQVIYKVNIKMAKNLIDGILYGGKRIVINYFSLNGGESYDDQMVGMDSVKIGKRIELSDLFTDISQVIYNGKFQNGNKNGLWNINQVYNGKTQKIGDGLYHYGKEGSLVQRLENWVELNNDYRECSYVTYVGQYQNGKKTGIWDTYWKYYSRMNKRKNRYMGYDKYEGKEDQKIFLIKICNIGQITMMKNFERGMNINIEF